MNLNDKTPAESARLAKRSMEHSIAMAFNRPPLGPGETVESVALEISLAATALAEAELKEEAE